MLLIQDFLIDQMFCLRDRHADMASVGYHSLICFYLHQWFPENKAIKIHATYEEHSRDDDTFDGNDPQTAVWSRPVLFCAMIPAGLFFKWEVLNRFICHVCSYVYELVVLKLVATALPQNILTFTHVSWCVYIIMLCYLFTGINSS